MAATGHRQIMSEAYVADSDRRRPAASRVTRPVKANNRRASWEWLGPPAAQRCPWQFVSPSSSWESDPQAFEAFEAVGPRTSLAK